MRYIIKRNLARKTIYYKIKNTYNIVFKKKVGLSCLPIFGEWVFGFFRSYKRLPHVTQSHSLHNLQKSKASKETKYLMLLIVCNPNHSHSCVSRFVEADRRLGAWPPLKRHKWCAKYAMWFAHSMSFIYQLTKWTQVKTHFTQKVIKVIRLFTKY